MPIYDFFCEKCELEKELLQSMSEYTGKENCTQCGNPMTRVYTRCKFHFTGTKIEDAEFNPGLGKVTKSKAHREELAKRMNVVEIGSDYKSPDSLHKQFDDDRETRKKRNWDEV